MSSNESCVGRLELRHRRIQMLHQTANEVTPSLWRRLVDQRRFQAENALRQRQDVLDVAYQRHPERFVRSAPKPPALPSEVWINKPVSTPKPPSVGEGR